MKKVILLMAACAITGWAQAAGLAVNNANNEVAANTIPKQLGELSVTRKSLGLGTPARMISIGTDTAVFVDDDYYHAPQDMPFYPTAGVIWPRVVELECEKVNGALVCEGYHWAPKLGRGEYLFVVPKLKTPPPPVVVNVVPAPPVIVYKEVPVKKKPE